MADTDRSGQHAARAWITVYLKGLLMGTADTIPGISGGTIALITGIYDRLVQAIAALHPSIIRHLPDATSPDGRAALIQEIHDQDIPFLAVLGAGIATAVVAVSGVMHTLLSLYPAPVNAFFLGLIAASAALIARTTAAGQLPAYTAGVAGFVAAYLVTGLSADTGIGHGVPVVFVAGAVASAAMILPGVSGAAFLYILGQYEYLTGTLKQVVTAVPAMIAGDQPVTGDVLVIAVFVAGAGAGVLTIAHAVRWALDRYRAATMAGLVGLMVGALRLPITIVLQNVSVWTVSTAAVIGGTAVLGAVLVAALHHVTDDITY